MADFALTANRLRLDALRHWFPRAKLDSFAAAVRRAAANCKFRCTLCELDQWTRNRMYSLFLSHAFHVHNDTPTAMDVCWDFRCISAPPAVELETLAEFVTYDEAVQITVDAIEHRFANETESLMVRLREAAALGATRVDIDETFAPELEITMINRNIHVCRGVHLCWEWKCRGK